MKIQISKIQSFLFFSVLLVSSVNFAREGVSQAVAPTKKYNYVMTSDRKSALLCPLVKIESLWIENELSPKGCASLTESGHLSSRGISYIIHAATGSMGSFDESTEPTLQSISESVKSSIRLAKIYGIKKIAIPLIGGKIFLDRLEMKDGDRLVLDTNEKMLILAKTIIGAVYAEDIQIEYSFIGYSETDADIFEQASTEILKNEGWLRQLKNWLENKLGSGDFSKRSQVIRGNILDFNLHHATAIVNPANMELSFGGGLSGAIAGAAGEGSSRIDNINKDLIHSYYKYYGNK